MAAVNAVTLVIGGIGMAVIVWGVLLSAVGFLRLEYRHMKGENICQQRDIQRHELGFCLLLGLRRT